MLTLYSKYLYRSVGLNSNFMQEAKLTQILFGFPMIKLSLDRNLNRGQVSTFDILLSSFFILKILLRCRV